MILPKCHLPHEWSIISQHPRICLLTELNGPSLERISHPNQRVRGEDWTIIWVQEGKLQVQDLTIFGVTKKRCLKLWNYQGERLMLYFHFRKQRRYFRNKVKIILEQFSFKHSVKIFRYFIAFLNRTLSTWKQLLRLSAISAISGT